MIWVTEGHLKAEVTASEVPQLETEQRQVPSRSVTPSGEKLSLGLKCKSVKKQDDFSLCEIELPSALWGPIPG